MTTAVPKVGDILRVDPPAPANGPPAFYEVTHVEGRNVALVPTDEFGVTHERNIQLRVPLSMLRHFTLYQATDVSRSVAVQDARVAAENRGLQRRTLVPREDEPDENKARATAAA